VIYFNQIPSTVSLPAGGRRLGDLQSHVPGQDRLPSALPITTAMKPYNSAQGTGSRFRPYQSAAAAVAATSATHRGYISSDGGQPVMPGGLFIHTKHAHQRSGGTQDTNGSGSGAFSEAIVRCPSTVYYFQAYAVNIKDKLWRRIEFHHPAPEINSRVTASPLRWRCDAATTDHTDFASVTIAAGTMVRTFTIQNTALPPWAHPVPRLCKRIGDQRRRFQRFGYSFRSHSGRRSATFQVTFDPAPRHALGHPVDANDDATRNRMISASRERERRQKWTSGNSVSMPMAMHASQRPYDSLRQHCFGTCENIHHSEYAPHPGAHRSTPYITIGGTTRPIQCSAIPSQP